MNNFHLLINQSLNCERKAFKKEMDVAECCVAKEKPRKLISGTKKFRSPAREFTLHGCIKLLQAFNCRTHTPPSGRAKGPQRVGGRGSHGDPALGANPGEISFELRKMGRFEVRSIFQTSSTPPVYS